MDPVPGGGQQTSPPMAGNYRPIRDIFELQAPGVLRPPSGSIECRDGRPPTAMGRAPGLCLSSLSPSQDGPQQSETVKGPRTDSDSSILASEGVVSGPAGTSIGASSQTPREEGPTQATPLPQVPPKPPRALPSCLETMQRFIRHKGFSKGVAKELTFARRPSTNVIYQRMWSVYRRWCRKKEVSSSRISLPKVADFLLYLRNKRKLSSSSIKGYRSMLASVFNLSLPEISSCPVLGGLTRSFAQREKKKTVAPPSWDLNKVLRSLMEAPFEPLQEANLRNLTKKSLFLLSLASVRRISEIQAISSRVASSGTDLSLTYLPEFVAKTETQNNPIPRCFLIKGLSDFAAGLEEGSLLCPVRVLKYYLKRTKKIQNRPKTLFISPNRPERAISKNAISFFLRETIAEASAITGSSHQRPRAHSIRGVGTSLSFWKNWSMAKVLEAATWKSNSVFTSFYLKDVEYIFEDCRSLGPFVSAGQILNANEN